MAAPADGSFVLATVSGSDYVDRYSLLFPPDTPSAPTAVAGDGQATITASAADSGATATSLTITSDPGALTCTINADSGSCDITGLTNGTAYTFTVVANGADGASAPSAASSSVTPVAPPGTQRVSWSPTTDLRLKAGSAVFKAAQSAGDGEITYEVTDAGNTGCTVDSGSLTLTYSAVGSCKVRAATATDSYLEGSKVVLLAAFGLVTVLVKLWDFQVTWLPTKGSAGPRRLLEICGG